MNLYLKFNWNWTGIELKFNWDWTELGPEMRLRLRKFVGRKKCILKVFLYEICTYSFSKLKKKHFVWFIRQFWFVSTYERIFPHQVNPPRWCIFFEINLNKSRHARKSYPGCAFKSTSPPLINIGAVSDVFSDSERRLKGGG